ncbi:MAG: Lipoprotein-releasing system ATP-binding protein LolD [Bacteroidota bacterium]
MVFCDNIKKCYGDIQVLKGVSLSVKPGEIAAIIGASGAGKSTLLQILGSLDSPDSGSVKINQTDIFALSKKELSEFRNKQIGFVFQSHQLLPEFSALENTILPGLISGIDKKKAEKRGLELLDYMGLSDRINHSPNKLSGGEQQRVSIARALFHNPKVVFADEPTGNLDSQNANQVQQLFEKLRKDLNQTFIIVTHNQAMADMADHIYTMKDGQL